MKPTLNMDAIAWVLRGVFPFPGGKRFSVEPLCAEMGPRVGDRTLCDPCVGAGIVVFKMLDRGLAGRVRINDRDPKIANYWNVLLHEHEALKRRVANWTPTAETIAFEWAKNRQGLIDGTDVDMAFSELVIRRASWNGLGLLEGSKNKNAPKRMHGAWSPKQLVGLINRQHRLLAGAVVWDICTSLDVTEVLAEPGPMFALIDPPYIGSGANSYAYTMTIEEHRRLADVLQWTPHEWLLCLDDAPLVGELYNQFEVEVVGVPHYTRAKIDRKAKPVVAETRIRSWQRSS